MNNQKGFSAVALLIVVIVLAALGFTGWTVYSQQQEADRKKSLSLEDSLQEIKSTLLREYTFLVDGADEISSDEVYYKPDGFDFYTGTSATKNHYLSVSTEEMISTITGEAEVEISANTEEETKRLKLVQERTHDLFMEYGFVEGDRYPDDWQFSDYGLYERTGAICTSSFGNSVNFACDYRKNLEAAAKKVEPFATAYKEQDKGEYKANYFEFVEEGEGKTKSDRYALVATGGPGAFFYKDGNEWKYFISSFEGFNCSDIKNNDKAAAAFATVCRPDGSDGL